MNEKMNKALVYFGREDLTDGLYENDIDDNVQVFLTIRQMIELYNLQSKIDKLDNENFELAKRIYNTKKIVNKVKKVSDYMNGIPCDDLLNTLEGK